jgi:hypothetical protein
MTHLMVFSADALGGAAWSPSMKSIFSGSRECETAEEHEVARDTEEGRKRFESLVVTWICSHRPSGPPGWNLS